MSPAPILSANSTACLRCHQSKTVDSLTGRCSRCHPIQINELPPDFQVYARKAQSQKYRELVIGLVTGPVLIGVYLYYAARGQDAPWLLWLLVIATIALIAGSVKSLRRKRTLLQRYHRLANVMQHVKPVDAELQYEVWNRGGRGSTRCYFKLYQLGPGSSWPAGVGQKIEIDIPPESEEQAVTQTQSFWKTLVAGYDPFEKPKLWGKVYFDPDRSGSAVICIQDGVFVSVRENN